MGYRTDFAWAALTYQIKWIYGIVGMLGNGKAVGNLTKSMKQMFSGADAEKDKRIAKIFAAAKKFKGRALKSVIVNLPAGLVFLLVRQTWGFWSYFLPVQFCLVPMTALKLCKLFTSGSKKKKSKR